MPCLALPCLALPCLALPCLALPCLALPCLALPCLASQEGVLMYSGLDLVPDSGELVMRRHDGREQTSPGFEFENYDQHAQNGTGGNEKRAYMLSFALFYAYHEYSTK
jgi:hypothetical protein